MQKLLVVSSAFNEEDNIEEFIEEINFNYENFINKRPDLAKYIDKINFLNDEKELINKVDYINIARNPESQYQFLIHNKHYTFKHLYIEKPLAHQTEAYKKCIENFETENTSFSVFYSLTYMDWYNNIIEEIIFYSRAIFRDYKNKLHNSSFNTFFHYIL